MPKRDYIEFQDRSVAKAYLITFRCYGTWFHGDERGSVDRRHHNKFGTPMMAPNEEQERREEARLKTAPFELDARKRVVVEKAIREVCQIREYTLFGINVRTNHVHLVVNNKQKPERMMDSFKAYSTKALRDADLIAATYKPWSRHGSTRYLWTEEHVAIAIDYVLNGQGDELPAFE